MRAETEGHVQLGEAVKKLKPPKVNQRRVVPVPVGRILLPCPALEHYDPTGATEEVDAFLARTRGQTAALALHTLAQVAQETDPLLARIGVTRVAAAMGLAKIAGVLIDRVQIDQKTENIMREKSDADLEMIIKKAEVIRVS